jgi:hypothetical protein
MGTGWKDSILHKHKLLKCSAHGLAAAVESCSKCFAELFNSHKMLSEALQEAPEQITALFAEGRDYLLTLKHIVDETPCQGECAAEGGEADPLIIHTHDCARGWAMGALEGHEEKLLSVAAKQMTPAGPKGAA